VKVTDSANLPARLEPMMLTHLALTGDLAQHEEWKNRIEAVHQADAVAVERDIELRRLLMRDAVWKRIRRTGKVAATINLSLGVVWMALLIPTYAIGWGFGWPAALTYLLPVPLAWKVTRKLFERAALKGMRDAGGSNVSLVKRAAMLPASAIRAGVAGFAFGGTLMFLQGLISWFMTPAPTLGLELYIDTLYALYAGLISGTVSTALAPFISRPPPK
jgi:hypothetical protein